MKVSLGALGACGIGMMTVLLACTKPPEGHKVEADAATVSGAPAAGLATPSNRKEVDELAERALACGWSETQGIVDDSCPALKEWKDSTQAQDPAAEPTLLAMLDDARAQVRWLAAENLWKHAKAKRADPLLATRLLEKALGEQQPLVARALGSALAHVDLEATGLMGRVREILQKGVPVDLCAGLASRVLERNPQLSDVALTLARQSKDSQNWWGLRFAPPADQPAVRALWLARADDADANVADEVYMGCSVYKECKPIWDDLLTRLEQRTQLPPSTALLLGYMFHETTDAKKRARLVTFAVRVVDDERHEDVVRSMTLHTLAEANERAAKSLAEKYQSGPPSLVQLTAKEILAGAATDAGADAAAK